MNGLTIQSARYLFILVTILLTSGCKGQENREIIMTEKILGQIDSLFSEFDRPESPGYAIGISKGSSTLYANGYGSANLDYNIPITPQSVFSIASVSKQFTAACLALLIQNGKVSLETPVATYIPELAKFSDTIKIKHLVYNTSGLTDYYRLPRPGGKSWITFNYFDVDECISTSLNQDTLLFKPGERWDYCNVNFMLIAKIVEVVSNQKFSDFANSNLFQPLGMKNSIIHDDITAVVKNRVTPYNYRTADYVEGYGSQGIKISSEGEFIQHYRNAPHYGGSGVMTSVEDLLIWSKNMVTKEFGGQSFFDIMHHTPSFDHDRNNQAFGLYIGDFQGRKIVAWDGGDYGISSQLVRFPDHEIAIVVLSNLGSGESFRKANEIAQILLDHGIIE